MANNGLIVSGNLGVGTITPTAVLQLKAGTTTASTAPLKFTAGTNMTAAEAGAVEWDGTSLFLTNSVPTRQAAALMVSTFLTNHGVVLGAGTATLGATAAGTAGQLLVSGGASADPTWQNGTVVLLATNVLGSGTATFDFTGFSASFTHLRIVGMVSSDRAASTSTIGIRFNTISTTTYNNQRIRGNSATASAAVENSATRGILCECPGATGVASFAAYFSADIPFYNGTVFYKTVLSTTGSLSTTAGDCFSQVWSSAWAGAAITTITIFDINSANMVTDSAFYLYGIL